MRVDPSTFSGADHSVWLAAAKLGVPAATIITIAATKTVARATRTTLLR
jgi:hypothetical protein